MKKEREYYERALGILHGYVREYAAEYPAQATRLGVANGASDDPHIERLLQGTAFLTGRTEQAIEENDNKMSEAILSVNYRHYLLPFPSTAIVHVDPGLAVHGMSGMNGTIRLPRGTMMRAGADGGASCRFRTVQDVHVSPLVVTEFAFHPIFAPPPACKRPIDVVSSISIGFECMADDPTRIDLDAVRALLAGQPSLCATVRDTLFLHTKAAWIELPGGRWQALDAVPLAAAGFAASDAVLPCPPTSHPAFRLLTEYFVFPERFNFIDIGWRPLAPHFKPECRRLTLHLGLDIRHDAVPARHLATLSRDNLLLNCTPVVNLFPHSACPIELDHTRPDYLLLPEGGPASAYDIYSVDKVSVLRAAARAEGRKQELTEFRPYYSLRHGEQRGKGAYYLVRRDAIRAVTHPGHEMRISLVDRTIDPLDMPNASASIDLTCTNRDLPARLRHGAPAGDLQLEQGSAGWTLRFLNRPTPQYRFSGDIQWRLVSQLALSHTALVQQGVDGLREALALYDLRQSALTQHQIRAIAALERRPARTWFRDEKGRVPVHGIAIRITLDEEAFTGTGLHLFAQVLDHFFGLCVHINSFTQLTIVSLSNGKELIRCKPRHGEIELA
ncbi:type VI secretion system baseplate subunit TssF [Pseudoduganella sp. SL102]|uniref:type VI secretion system baseplate subunit TssF n=1 Tax=Pseudoduganella sp. SL102 TaxID=2995154 RepID=UPI00248AFA27|nr:type VI secretion system baseplate subunit TssF [Pseudoduganella sp. SL102]WBS03980.1 type VI secretion system baseplate subunit TssF [Pseudoduganella sp. SL102]